MRISGITILDDKKVERGLTIIYGIGLSLSRKILAKSKIDPLKKVSSLSKEEQDLLKNELGNYKIEADLKRQIASNIKRLKDINSYRGSRHIKKLPARGQTTKTNSRTVKGNVRKTLATSKIKVTKK